MSSNTISRLKSHICELERLLKEARSAQPQAPAPSLDARGIRLQDIPAGSLCVTCKRPRARGDTRLDAEGVCWREGHFGCGAAPSAPPDALREAMGLLRLVRCCAGQDPLTNCTMFKAVNAWRRKNDPEWRAPDGSAAPTAPKEPQR